MKKLMIMAAAVFMAALLPASAFAASLSAARGPASHAVRHSLHGRCGSPCNGYYSLYTYVAPCHGGLSGGGCGRGGYTWICGGIFGW